MTNKNLEKHFDKLIKKYTENDKFRETIIAKSREIIKLSKLSIYSFHRDDFSKGKELLSSAKKLIIETNKIINSSNLREVGSFRASLEEFIEGSALEFFLQHKTIPSLENLNLSFPIHDETYLLGLCDFSGELVRRAVSCATNNNPAEVELIKNTLEELYGLFLKFNFRSGELRKKFDSLRHNLSKVNNIVYDIKLRGCNDEN